MPLPYAKEHLIYTHKPKCNWRRRKNRFGMKNAFRYLFRTSKMRSTHRWGLTYEKFKGCHCWGGGEYGKETPMETLNEFEKLSQAFAIFGKCSKEHEELELSAGRDELFIYASAKNFTEKELQKLETLDWTYNKELGGFQYNV